LKKLHSIFISLLLFGCTQSSYQLASRDLVSDNRNAALGYPTSDFPEILISRDEYLISWNKNSRVLNWSVWRLSIEDLGQVKRSNDFMQDPALQKTVSNAVLPSEYKGSCFDRGHQTPSGDRTSTKEHNNNTFYMSNMLPQTAHLNRGVWKHLEEHERELAKKDVIFIYAGPIFDENPQGIGPASNILVPLKNFKIITDDKGKVLVAVILPNVTSTGTNPLKDRDQLCFDSKHAWNPQAEQDWSEFNVSVEEIEKQAKLNFNFLK